MGQLAGAAPSPPAQGTRRVTAVSQGTNQPIVFVCLPHRNHSALALTWESSCKLTSASPTPLSQSPGKKGWLQERAGIEQGGELQAWGRDTNNFQSAGKSLKVSIAPETDVIWHRDAGGIHDPGASVVPR